MLRRTPVRRRRSKPRRSSRVVDEDFKAIVRTLPCRLRILLRCEGPVEADHQGPHGLGMKADDTTCVPMCRKHHRERTDYTGPFKDWDASMMRAFCDANIEYTRPIVEALRARESREDRPIAGARLLKRWPQERQRLRGLIRKLRARVRPSGGATTTNHE